MPVGGVERALALVLPRRDVDARVDRAQLARDGA
jgi:hypothetical protein